MGWVRLKAEQVLCIFTSVYLLFLIILSIYKYIILFDQYKLALHRLAAEWEREGGSTTESK